MTGVVFVLAVAVDTALAAIMLYEMIDRHRLRYRWANLAVVATTLAALFEIGHQSGLLIPLCAMLAAWGVVLGLMRRRERRFARNVEAYVRERGKRRRR